MKMRRNNRRPPSAGNRITPEAPPAPPEAPPPPFYRTRPPLIYTPANCQKLNCLKLVSGWAETGWAVSVIIDGNDERIVTADDRNRWSLTGVELPPGYHTITVKYAEPPSPLFSRVWVYINEPSNNPPV